MDRLREVVISYLIIVLIMYQPVHTFMPLCCDFIHTPFQALLYRQFPFSSLHFLNGTSETNRVKLSYNDFI